eukprot:m.75864 g.75864  ORF g.75864 m.75864 type:complete len:563 (+) comp24834_c0_seq1:76-1764(+)
MDLYKMNTLLCTCIATLTTVSLATAAVTNPSPKHVIVTVIDDLGFDDFGYANDGQTFTPTFNQMHSQGIALTQYYVQPSCSPTRATILTGRKPVHTGINLWIPNAAYGLPLNETTMAQVLNGRGYTSHAVGKWHLGCYKTPYLPTYRGFSSFYGYYEGSEDYISHNYYGNGLDFHQEDEQNCSFKSGCSKLLWDTVGVGNCDRNGSCSVANYWDYYSTHLFTARAIDIINSHGATTTSNVFAATSSPMFLYLAFQAVHEPRQCPQHYVDRYNTTIDDDGRRVFAGMLGAVDEGMANITAALREAAMYDDTLIIVTTDNGGPTTECSSTGQSNWPLRGSKCSIWEGGTKGAGFLFWSGLPKQAQGLVWGGLIHAADWLPTIVSALTTSGVVHGETLPLDGVDLWQALLTNATSPRTEIYYGVNQASKGPAVRNVEGFKLILSDSGGGKGEWSQQQLPNTSSSSPLSSKQSLWTPMAYGALADRGPAPNTTALLYNIILDTGEHMNLSLAAHAQVVTSLEEIVARYAETKVPQAQSDPSCPPFTGINTTDPNGNIAKYIGAWCD